MLPRYHTHGRQNCECLEDIEVDVTLGDTPPDEESPTELASDATTTGLNEENKSLCPEEPPTGPVSPSVQLQVEPIDSGSKMALAERDRGGELLEYLEHFAAACPPKGES